MAKVVTENFRVESTNEFVDSFATANGNNYYIMASSMAEDTTISNTQKDIREFQRKVIFGNKIASDDVRYMFDIKPWSTGTVYDAFDDTQDMSTKNFYVTVLDGTINETSYKVFKCIRNNDGAVSTDKPSTADLNSLYEKTSRDGYVWKYLFDVPPAQYLLFGTSKFLPYIANSTVSAAAQQGISDIIIQNSDVGAFKAYLVGEDDTPTKATISSVSESVVANRYELSLTTTKIPKSGSGSYQNMYVRVTNTGQIFDIVTSAVPSGVDTTTNRTLILFVDNPTTLSALAGQSCEVIPKIEVTPPDNATGTRAIAYGVLNNEGTLTSVNFQTKGSGYTFAQATVSKPPAIELSSTTAKTIMSPNGGHGSDPVHELFMSRVATVTSFVTDTNTSIPPTNTFTKVGLVKNPTFRDSTHPADFDNRTLLIINGVQLTDLQASVGFHVSQTIGTQTVSGTIHQITKIGGNTQLYIVDAVGPYSAEFSTGSFSIKQTSTSTNTTYVGTINTITLDKYTPYTGEVMHFVDFDPITRTETSKEKVKLIFDF